MANFWMSLIFFHLCAVVVARQDIGEEEEDDLDGEGEEDLEDEAEGEGEALGLFFPHFLRQPSFSRILNEPSTINPLVPVA